MYGNTRYDAREGEYRCQHGPEECYMDLFENCLIGYTKGDSRLSYPWIRCAGKLIPRGNRFNPPALTLSSFSVCVCVCSDEVVKERYPNVEGIGEAMVEACAEMLPPGITAGDLTTCSDGPLGKKLLERARRETESLQPKVRPCRANLVLTTALW